MKQEEDDSAASASLLQVPRAALSEEPSREPTVPRMRCSFFRVLDLIRV